MMMKKEGGDKQLIAADKTNKITMIILKIRNCLANFYISS
jgi:hypothetical protein